MVKLTTTTDQNPSVVPSPFPNFNDDINWIQDGVQVAGGKKWGTDLSHLNFPAGIYVADYSYNRIVEWKSGAKSGQVVTSDGEKCDRGDRLHSPIDVIYDKITDNFIIADQGNRRVVRWPRQQPSNIQFLLRILIHGKLGEPIGTVVAGGNGKGPHINQLSLPTCIFVEKDQSVYVSDWGNHRVVKWEKDAKQGIFIAGGQEQRNISLALVDPFGLIVDQSGTLFVAHWGKNRIVRYSKGVKLNSTVVGAGGNCSGSNQLCHPMFLAFDRQGNLYVSDYTNHRVQKFNIQSNYIAQR